MREKIHRKEGRKRGREEKQRGSVSGGRLVDQTRVRDGRTARTANTPPPHTQSTGE
ncbi:hypothetical protein PAHAL_9G368600 [Panicum hallii]|uniref:Uncharacterized protein n=1 Tax=Panicum hallii TaxID=206008 RepID=A0A2T8I3U2_9POAL|nr:hypothetical protein PAHAL_9G368600 [Panicum hallii]